MRVHISLPVLALSALLTRSAFAGEAVTYFHGDVLGSPVAATDQAGFVRWRAGYRPYGDLDQTASEQLASADNRQWFTGHVLDDGTGLTYAKARHFDTRIGRFLSIDPVGFTAENDQSFGRYLYANNNPYRFIDPTGRYYEIVGSEDFKQIVETHIATLRTHDEGRMLVDQIDWSFQTVTIQENFGGNATVTGKNAYNGKGEDPRIYFDPSLTRSCCGPDGGALERPAYIGLAHELIHALLAMQGKHPDIDNVTEQQRERPVIIQENKIRAEHAVPLLQVP